MTTNVGLNVTPNVGIPMTRNVGISATTNVGIGPNGPHDQESGPLYDYEWGQKTMKSGTFSKLFRKVIVNNSF